MTPCSPLTYVSLATALALTTAFSCLNSCLISSRHDAIYLAFSTNETTFKKLNTNGLSNLTYIN